MSQLSCYLVMQSLAIHRGNRFLFFQRLDHIWTAQSGFIRIFYESVLISDQISGPHAFLECARQLGTMRLANEVGPLVMGRIGHPDTASLTVIGSTVNTAARLEALSKEKNCQLVVSEEVMESAGLAGHGFARETVAIRGLAAAREIVIVPPTCILRKYCK